MCSPISNCANASSLLYNRLRSAFSTDATNWVGFYFRSGKNTLQLGPFCGEPACQTLRLDKGVCGHCATEAKSVLVPDVHEFPGHIACDEKSRSELVIPIKTNVSDFRSIYFSINSQLIISIIVVEVL